MSLGEFIETTEGDRPAFWRRTARSLCPDAATVSQLPDPSASGALIQDSDTNAMMRTCHRTHLLTSVDPISKPASSLEEPGWLVLSVGVWKVQSRPKIEQDGSNYTSPAWH